MCKSLRHFTPSRALRNATYQQNLHIQPLYHFPHPSLYFYFFLSLLFVSFCLLICGFFFPFSILYSLNFSFSPVCVLPLFFTLNLSVYFFRMQLFIILYHSYRFVHFVCSIHRTDLAHSGDRPHAQRRRQLMTKYSCQIK